MGESVGDVALVNPYFDAVAGGVSIGPDRETYSKRAVELSRERQELVETYAWAIPNHEAIATIVEHDPILEVGAGTGYWAWLIRQAGGTVLPCDTAAPVGADHLGEWVPVWKADGRDVVRDYPDQTLLMVWPPYGESLATEVLGTYASEGGDTCIYVGEGRGGCTADDRFHRMLHEEWELEETVAIPSYLGIRDRLEVWGKS